MLSFITMLDIIAIIYFTISNLYLLGNFPLHIYEFLDLRSGYALSDYGILFETGTYFSVSAIITGLLCGLDAITNPIYKRRSISKKLYNLHALSSFALIGIGIYPTTLIPQYPSRIIHWLFALTFMILYPLTRILILKKFNKRISKQILIAYIITILSAIAITLGVKFEIVLYPEYLLWLGLMFTIIISKIIITEKKIK